MKRIKEHKLSQPISDPFIIVHNILDNNAARQRYFLKAIERNRRKHSRLIGKTTNKLRELRNLDKVKVAQDNRRNLFTKEMIGERPPKWSLRKKPREEDLPKIQRAPYYPTKEDVPDKIFSNPEYFNESGLSPKGKLAVRNGKRPPLPEGWIECSIEHVVDIDVPEAPVLEPPFKKTVDEGRIYYWKERTGEVSFCPPVGSSAIANEAFKHFGRIGL